MNSLSSDDDISLYSLMLQRHVLYFIPFRLLAAVTFCVAEELVALITTCPMSAFNCNRLQSDSDVGARKKVA